MYHLKLNRGEKQMKSKFAETPKNHERMFYGIVEFKDNRKPQLLKYSSQFRNVANVWFEEQARLSEGQLGHINTFK